jgi:Uracil DNA glycosylase superfamily.
MASVKRKKPLSDRSDALILAARNLGAAVGRLKFSNPVTHVYNPLDYAWTPHELYLRRFGKKQRRIIFLGMNPGPFGMVQTGVPFGEIAAVREWLKIAGEVRRPSREHPRRPITGFACTRSEVSGQRLWGLFADRFGHAANFFEDHLVVNYCPLAFIETTGRNRTPDKLPPEEKARLLAVCDQHIRLVASILEPEWIIGIGDFALKRAQHVFSEMDVRLGRILHPSPASPAANRDWSGEATRQLKALGVWK